MGRIYRSDDKKLPASVSKLFALVQEEIADTGMIRRRLTESKITIKAFSEDEEMVIEGIANFSALDRCDEIIPANAWEKRIDNYMKNPIILREHRREWPIGKCLSLEYKDGLRYRAQIGNPKLAPLTAMQIESRSLIAQDILKTNSVGFIPHLIEWDEDEEIIRHTDVELLEISVVAIPMQQDSVITSVKSWRKENMKNASTGKKEEGSEPSMADLKGMLEETLTICKGCMEGIKSLIDAKSADAADDDKEEEEGKALTAENEALKKRNEDLVAKLTDLETKSTELLSKLKDSGILG